MPKNHRDLSPEEVYALWRNIPDCAKSKVEIFASGVLLSPTRRRGREIRQTMPDKPSQEILDAMIKAGAKESWAKDIYKAIKDQVNEKEKQ